MTDENPQKRVGRTETDAAVDIATAAAAPQYLDHTDGLYVVTAPAGAAAKVIDPQREAEWRAERPRRKRGNYTAHSPESFTQYVQRHATDDTEVWADKVGRKVVAVLNGHGADTPGHGDHRITLGVDRSASWLRWKGADGVQMRQGDFADFIQQAAEQVVKPSAATLLDIAQTVTGHKAVQFESAERNESGDVSVVWKEETTASAGKNGRLTIPSSLTLQIQPFVGARPAMVEASLRYRVTKDGVTLGYVLINPDAVEEAVFDLYIESIATSIEDVAPLFYGVTA